MNYDRAKNSLFGATVEPGERAEREREREREHGSLTMQTTVELLLARLSNVVDQLVES